MADPRSGNAAVAVGSAIYVLGGFSRRVATATVLKFDSTHATWSEAAHLPRARSYVAACAIGSEIFVFGGYRDFNTDDGDSQASVYKLDTVTNEWSTQAPLPLGCAGHSVSVLGGLVYIVGVGPLCNAVLRFDPVSDVSTMLSLPH
jgi:N-acetylneuraminic acid mutarotase